VTRLIPTVGSKNMQEHARLTWWTCSSCLLSLQRAVLQLVLI
jgi:hypothetical protein